MPFLYTSSYCAAKGYLPLSAYHAAVDATAVRSKSAKVQSVPMRMRN